MARNCVTWRLVDRPAAATEVQLSAFNAMLHSYTVAELPIAPRAFESRAELAGPILVAADESKRALLIAYEHGAQIPDSFLHFKLGRHDEIALLATKANYVPNQPADGYSTVWMQAAVIDAGIDALASEYRRFLLRGLSTAGDTRQPYIFYNTWNFQERNKWFNHHPYLESMNPARILAEIEIAHRMGIDVFVMDTGWYEKTGDWEVSPVRFPDRLREVRSRLDRYGMKLGLWFDPDGCRKILEDAGRKPAVCPNPRWTGRQAAANLGTEESFPMCLVSPYSDAFADTLIRVANETGARYFKWDAIAQYGCDSPHHWHGGPANTQVERWNSYAFQLPQQMARVAQKIAAAIPDAIIDFDITEAGRAVGLSFLGRQILPDQ